MYRVLQTCEKLLTQTKAKRTRDGRYLPAKKMFIEKCRCWKVCGGYVATKNQVTIRYAVSPSMATLHLIIEVI